MIEGDLSRMVEIDSVSSIKFEKKIQVRNLGWCWPKKIFYEFKTDPCEKKTGNFLELFFATGTTTTWTSSLRTSGGS